MRTATLLLSCAVVGLLVCGALGVKESWNSKNHPSRFKLEGLVTNHDQITANGWLTGRSEKIAWPSYYWATYRDGPNYRWHKKKMPNGKIVRDLSPLEKYDLAFNKWGQDWTQAQWEDFLSLKPFDPDNCVEGYYKTKDANYYKLLGPAAKWYSDNAGNYKARNGKDDDGDGKIDECEDLDGQEKWEGLCHAWAPAAILEPEPHEAVKINGVEFLVSDIKALIMLEYDRTYAFSIGSRCNLKKDDVPLDEWGRMSRRECRDTNPGAVHVTLANILGNHKRPMVVDRTRDYEVWNQPVVGFTSIPIKEFTEKVDACVWLGHSRENCKLTPFSSVAERYVAYKTEMDWVTESSPSVDPQIPNLTWFMRKEVYYYVVEIDASGDVVGGEYHKDSKAPDFFWLPTGISQRRATGKNPLVHRDTVFNLLKMSRKNDVIEEFAWNQSEVKIPHYSEDGVHSQVDVTRQMVLEEITVSVDIDHSYVGDLQVILVFGGSEIILHDRKGGSKDDLRLAYDVEALKGSLAKGKWTLLIKDLEEKDSGVLKKWSVTVRGSPPHENVVDAEAIPSGLWKGYFTQQGYQFNVDMGLRFQKGEVTGDGQDAAGVYEVAGSYSEKSNGNGEVFTVTFEKRYNNAHVVKYTGTYTTGNNVLAGKWTIKQGNHTAEGTFRLNPHLYS